MLQLAEHSQKLDYFISINHRLLHNNILKDYRIGCNGQNVSLVILMLNRSELTIRLLKSLVVVEPAYGGEIILYDNNSTFKELRNIEKFLKSYALQVKLVKSKTNNGIGPARNVAVDHASNKWVMFLDNDTYFVKNPFSCLDITTSTGAHFINLPLLDADKESIFAYGGMLYVSKGTDNNILLSQSSVYRGTKLDISMPFLSDFLYGGCALLRKDSFLALGRFDKRYFIGSEDLEFSLRAYMSGYKIATAPILSLVHDNISQQYNYGKSTMDYYNARLHKGRLSKSISMIEREYGIKLCDNGIKWAEERKKYYQSLASGNKECLSVALIVDVRGWAFDSLAHSIISGSSGLLKIRLFYTEDYENIIDLLQAVHSADVVHFFYRFYINRLFGGDIELYLKHYPAKSAKELKIFLQRFLRETVITTGVPDFFCVNMEEELLLWMSVISPHYYTTNKKLFALYSQERFPYKPTQVIRDRINIKPFLSLKRDYKNLKVIKIGWAGNSKAGDWWGLKYSHYDNYKDIKGVKTIIKPAVAILKKLGYQVKLVLQDSAQNKINSEGMISFYRSIDIYVCGSKSEGTPLPVMEAMAAGLPIVSTDVGVVSEIFGPKQKRFVTKAISAKDLADKLLLLIKNKRMWPILAKENRRQVIKWHRVNIAKDFTKFFNTAHAAAEQNEVVAKKRLDHLDKILGTKKNFVVLPKWVLRRIATTRLVTKLLRINFIRNNVYKCYFVLKKLKML